PIAGMGAEQRSHSSSQSPPGPCFGGASFLTGRRPPQYAGDLDRSHGRLGPPRTMSASPALIPSITRRKPFLIGDVPPCGSHRPFGAPISAPRGGRMPSPHRSTQCVKGYERGILSPPSGADKARYPANFMNIKLENWLAIARSTISTDMAEK